MLSVSRGKPGHRRIKRIAEKNETRRNRRSHLDGTARYGRHSVKSFFLSSFIFSPRVFWLGSINENMPGSAGGPRFGTKTRSLLPDTRSSPASSSPRATASQNESFGSGSISGFRGVSGTASSSSLLSKMRERSSAWDGKGSGHSVSPVDSPEMSLDEGSREGLVVKIRDFLYERGGRAVRFFSLLFVHGPPILPSFV